jgi:hypothetical protein
VVEMKMAKAIHKALSKDYKIWKTSEDGCKKLIRATVKKVHINKLKDGTTFFRKVFTCDLLEHLEKNSTGLHAHDIAALCSNMLLLYKNTVSMPDFILAMEEVQKKAKRVVTAAATTFVTSLATTTTTTTTTATTCMVLER